MAAGEHEHVVFFDGECLLCLGSVSWLIEHDPDVLLRFAPMQGVTAHALLPAAVRDDPESFVYLRRGEQLVRSQAALAVVQATGCEPWASMARVAGAVVPQALADAVYGLVARHRLQVFGRVEADKPGTSACPLPSPEQARRLLP